MLDDLERRSRLAIVRFTDGEVYELRIVSTMHAEEGGDIIAEVIRTISPRASETVRDGAFIDFFLADVESVTLDGICIFGVDGVG
jgi:hypothetical protein